MSPLKRIHKSYFGLFEFRLYIPVNNFSVMSGRFPVQGFKDITPCPWFDSNSQHCDQDSGTLPTELTVLPINSVIFAEQTKTK